MIFRIPLFLVFLISGLAVGANPDQMVPKNSETLRLDEVREAPAPLAYGQWRSRE